MDFSLNIDKRNFFMRIPLVLFLLLPAWALGQKQLELRDKTYEPQIRTVICYPDQPSEAPYLLPAATRLESQNLVIEFDDLQDRKNNYYAKLLHCNYDWTRSTWPNLD